MIYAYDKRYLEKARVLLGRMFDYAVYDLKYSLNDIFQLFLDSPYSYAFENGSPSLLVGKSGFELAYDLTGHSDIKFGNRYERSAEYWTGWALAYYQWYSALPFKKINEFITIDKILLMYPKYHEMDIRQFTDKLDELYHQYHTVSNLKARRLEAGLTQVQLSSASGIPLRTIQQYEQKIKNINAAKAESAIMLAQALSTDVKNIIENI